MTDPAPPHPSGEAKEVYLSDWRRIDQAMIDAFADATDDHQFIHVDPERAAAETPFGGTIAHGFLTLSMLSRFAIDALPEVPGRRHGINYGFDKVRFLTPVRAGARIRGRFVPTSRSERGQGQIMTRYRVTVEIEGEERPALVADWLTLAVVG